MTTYLVAELDLGPDADRSGWAVVRGWQDEAYLAREVVYWERPGGPPAWWVCHGLNAGGVARERVRRALEAQ